MPYPLTGSAKSATGILDYEPWPGIDYLDVTRTWRPFGTSFNAYPRSTAGVTQWWDSGQDPNYLPEQLVTQTTLQLWPRSGTISAGGGTGGYDGGTPSSTYEDGLDGGGL